MKLVKNLILIDGDCMLCNRLAQFIIKRDPEIKFHFASLQSAYIEKLLSTKFQLDLSNHKLLKSIILIQDNKIYRQSTAVLRILKTMKGGWQILYYLGQIFPAFFKNFIYDWIARNRIKWFGTVKVCEIPNENFKNHFLVKEDDFKFIFPLQESHSQSY